MTKYSEYAYSANDLTTPIFLCVKSQIDEVFDITVYNSNTKYDTLADALGTGGEHIPATLRRGGMSVKYIQNSDNKYVQWRFMLSGSFTTAQFTNEANWQKQGAEVLVSENNFTEGDVLAKFKVGNTEYYVKNGFYVDVAKKSILALDDASDINNKKDVSIVDEHGNILAIISSNGIKTKEFNPTITSKILSQDKQDEIKFIDTYGNILAIIDEFGIKTKKYNSQTGLKSDNISLSNCEIITILGSSFGETEAFPTNKHWSGIVSMFSDYRVQNISQGGANIVATLYNIRRGSWKIQGKYVAITNNENIGDLNVTEYIHALDNLCSTLVGMGKVPIICSSYHKSQFFTLALRNYAYENKWMYWDCSEYSNSLVKGIYQGFDDGAHLRKRNVPLVAYAYLENMKGLSRPLSSIKIFRLRDEDFDGNIDELIYTNNIERARLFNELKISSTSNLDEYNLLIEHTPISFSNFALIDCILPSTSDNIKSIALKTNLVGNVEYFIKNSIARPYPNPSLSSAVRFSIEDSINTPMIGDVYTYGGTNYTVVSISMGENGYYCTIYCTPNTLPASQSGTLAMVSQMAGSTGSTSINFVLAESVSLNLKSYVENDNKGHWESLGSFNQNGAETIILPDDLIGSVDIDKISILIKNNDSSFTMSDVSLELLSFKNKEKKDDYSKEWEENNFIHTNELIDEPVFGVVGTELENWKGENGATLTTVADYEQRVSGNAKYPSGAESEIIVTDEITMNTTISESKLNKFGKMYLELCCRYFPQAPIPYTQGTDTEVNNTSYDFNTLFIQLSKNQLGSDNQTIVLQEEIGLFWKIIRIPIVWYWEYYYGADILIKDLNIKLYSNNKGIEICRASLKYIN